MSRLTFMYLSPVTAHSGALLAGILLQDTGIDSGNRCLRVHLVQ